MSVDKDREFRYTDTSRKGVADIENDVSHCVKTGSNPPHANETARLLSQQRQKSFYFAAPIDDSKRKDETAC